MPLGRAHASLHLLMHPKLCEVQRSVPPSPLPPCRLRAALNSTQGTDPLFLQHLGATPASAEPARPGSRLGSKRASVGLRRDSESGALSDR